MADEARMMDDIEAALKALYSIRPEAQADLSTIRQALATREAERDEAREKEAIIKKLLDDKTYARVAEQLADRLYGQAEDRIEKLEAALDEIGALESHFDAEGVPTIFVEGAAFIARQALSTEEKK